MMPTNIRIKCLILMKMSINLVMEKCMKKIIKNNVKILVILLSLLLISCSNEDKENLNTNTTNYSSDFVIDETNIDEEMENASKIKIETETTKDNKKNAEDRKYPRVDGSTANIPLMAEIRSKFLNEDIITSQNESLKVSTTDYAWMSLVDGNTDLLLVYEASDETKKYIEESGVKLKKVPIGVDALVFIVNEKNKINDLSTEEIKKIYTGQIKNWKELGGDDLNIEAFQRPTKSGSQTLFLNIFMKDISPMFASTYYVPESMEDVIEKISTYNDSANAIGFSVYYYAKKMYQVPGLKLLSVDGVEPTDETIASGEYKYLNPFYLVIREDTEEDTITKKLYDFILSDEGKECLINAGYIPVK